MTERPIRRQQLLAARATETHDSWSHFREFAASGDFQLVAVFSLIGLLIALNLILRFPDLGAVIAQYNQF